MHIQKHFKDFQVMFCKNIEDKFISGRIYLKMLDFNITLLFNYCKKGAHQI